MNTPLHTNMRVRPKSANSDGLRFRLLVLLAWSVNLVCLFLIYDLLELKTIYIYFSSSAFWLTLFFWPACFEREDIFYPRNFILFMFFMTMVIAPPLLYYDGVPTSGVPKFYFHQFAGKALLLWCLAFVAYVAGLYGGAKSARAKSHRSALCLGPPAVWMSITGTAAVVLGVLGLVIAAGSLTKALNIRGQVAAGRALFMTVGNGRYLVWLNLTPAGTVLLWYYCYKRWKLGRLSALFLVFALYGALLPFYSYTGGRGAALFPLALLLIVYYRSCFRFSWAWVILGLVILLPILALWRDYRIEGAIPARTESDAFSTVILGDLSRLDVSLAAVGGASERQFPLFYGESLLAAVEHVIPEWMIGRQFNGGTMLMAKAMHGDKNYNLPSPKASPVMIEGYLNFGIPGIILFMGLLGVLVRRVERLYETRDILTFIFGVSFSFMLPFGASLELHASQIVWRAVFPLGVFIFCRSLLKGLARSLVRGPKRLYSGFGGLRW